MRFEPVVLERKPDMVLVYGDMNSYGRCRPGVLQAANQVGHVEAGLRSFDRTMPEEINRLVTDQLADLAIHALGRRRRKSRPRGHRRTPVHRVGNIMIDSLVRLLPVAMGKKLNGLPDRYILVTLHRPANVGR